MPAWNLLLSGVRTSKGNVKKRLREASALPLVTLRRVLLVQGLKALGDLVSR